VIVCDNPAVAANDESTTLTQQLALLVFSFNRYDRVASLPGNCWNIFLDFLLLRSGGRKTEHKRSRDRAMKRNENPGPTTQR
jgi:hypothetical protein